jgi:hypothetical protein
MSVTSSTVGFGVIVALYAVIGLLAAAGSAAVSRRLFTRRSEQLFYGLFLTPIAGFYLAFTAYFGEVEPWRTELCAVAIFAAVGLIGARYAPALILGYVLHGLWDALHELSAHAGAGFVDPDQLTAIPLAYGVFCLTYDVAVSVYFARRFLT